MKIICILLLSYFSPGSTNWGTNFEEAKKTASQKHQLIVLNFSGSDWCGPCIRMRKEIFENNVFVKYADSSLVLVNADFPRLKKNALSKELTKQNESLADKYNSQGKFPFTLVLTADGKVLKSYEGLPDENAEEFTNQLKRINSEHQQ